MTVVFSVFRTGNLVVLPFIFASKSLKQNKKITTDNLAFSSTITTAASNRSPSSSSEKYTPVNLEVKRKVLSYLAAIEKTASLLLWIFRLLLKQQKSYMANSLRLSPITLHDVLK